MSFRGWLGRRLARGPSTKDDNEPIEIGLVSLAQGPMLVTLLRDRDFDAIGFPAMNLATRVGGDYRILVPRRQAVDAVTALDELR